VWDDRDLESSLLAGAAKVDITPDRPVWMDGMIRSHPSVGVHDPLFARALVLANGRQPQQMFALVALDVCSLGDAHGTAARQAVAERTGLPPGQVVIAATHTHSGPATMGYFNPAEPAYTRELVERVAQAVAQAAAGLQPAAVGWGCGREETISHYRRLLAADGRVVMNWEPCPPEQIVRPLGEADPEVTVLQVVGADSPHQPICLLFHHAGHPNIMSGDNYLLSADYPGVAAGLLEAAWGGLALFLNGAQGSVDIDGLRHRDWAGMARAGTSLARAVSEAAHSITPSHQALVRMETCRYHLPGRRLTPEEWAWAEQVLARTQGKVAPLADGVGEDFKAVFYRELRRAGGRPLPVEQQCLTVAGGALLTFPGELYTEIGRRIKGQSPFTPTCLVGLAGGDVGYVPTAQAIREGGYAEQTRRVDEAAEQIVVKQSLALLSAACERQAEE